MPNDPGTQTVAAPETPATPETPPEVDVPNWLSTGEFDDILSDESAKSILSRIDSPVSAAKVIVDSQKALRSGFRLPEKLTADHIAQLQPHIDAIMGVPEKAEMYPMQRPEEIDPALDLSEETKMSLRALAKTKHWSEDSTQAVYELYLNRTVQEARIQARALAEKRENERQDVVAKMKNLWGPLKYEKLMGTEENPDGGLIQQFAKSYATDENEYTGLIDALTQSGLSNNRLLFSMLGKAAEWHEIMDGTASVTRPAFAADKATAALSQEQMNAQRFRNTPKSLGGGAPG